MGKSRFDLVIAGGGIIGAMVAWRTLRRHADWRVLWIDSSMFGFGASAYAGALLTPFGRTEEHRALLTTGFKLLTSLEQEGDQLPLQELTGWYVVSQALAEARRDWFVASVGRPSTSETERFRRLMPHFELRDRVALGPFKVRQGRPVEFIALILILCRNSPTFSIWEGVELNSWVSQGDSVQLSVQGEGLIETDRLALATGAWAASQLATGSSPSTIRSKRVAACHIEIPPADDASVVYLGDHDAFLLPLVSEKRWLFGFPSEKWDVQPAAFRSELDDRDRAAADAILQEYSSLLAGQRHGGRAFYDGYAPDRVPVVSAIGGDRRVVFAGAGAGSGFRYSMGLAERLLDVLEGAGDQEH